MFSENPGPTALRRDLVLALSFADAEAAVRGPEGSERALAALSGVWNGSKGYVAILIRSLERAQIRRFTYGHPLHTEAEVWGAVEEGIAFLEGMGFQMDPAEFGVLAEGAQKARLQAWDMLRKGSQEAERAVPAAPPRSAAAPILVEPASSRGADPAQTGGAVLGRVAVVRGAEQARARLLAQY